ncbi:MAG: shikimate dehydrogenase [Dehalococcoidia bacterium]|nr:shikimate dehydrogenase [Dehalococcoidia bacterium]
MSEYIGLIGYPLKHSISPCFQQAALDHYQLGIRYEARETDSSRLREAVDDLRRPANLGANVTVPYKEAVLSLLDEIDDVAGLVGAVNTIIRKGDRLLGSNTDVHGFVTALYRERRFDAEGKRVVMLGAGGAARAAGFALLQKRVASLAITDGIPGRAEGLAAALRAYADGPSLWSEQPAIGATAFAWENVNSAATFENCDLIVHCTTVGMRHGPQEGESPLKREVIPRGALVYDLVYNPWPTPLLKLAQEAGADILGGLPMLVYQGAASFEMWTGRAAPVDIMFSKAKQALTGRKQ